MMTTHEEIFAEIRDAMDVRIKLRVRYSRLYSLLNKICIERSENFQSEFSGLFSRLYAVCQESRVDYHSADRFRRNALLVLHGKKSGCEEDFRNDVADLCHFVSSIYHCPRPEDMPVNVQGFGEEDTVPDSRGERFRCMRVVVDDVAEHQFTCIFEGQVLMVDMRDEDEEMLDCLMPGTVVNLIDAVREGRNVKPDVLIVEPDYLIDVSALTACIRPYGSHPLNYFLSRILPREVTLPILLGNAANQFMDDCVNQGEDGDYQQAFRQHFRDSVLDYIYADECASNSFFQSARQQYENIRSSVRHTFPSHEVGIRVEEVLLEPAFICEALGLRGRLDLMTADGHRLVELKSGKAQEYGARPSYPREEHVLQMSLYREILHHNLGLYRHQINGFLFYSKYPAFFHQRSPAEAVRGVLRLRNKIVAMERRIRHGGLEAILPQLTEEVLNEKGLDTPFYLQYLRPSLTKALAPLLQMDDVAHKYFSSFLAFIYREQFLAKTNDGRPDSTRGFARTWTADLTTKLLAGDILINLRIVRLEGDSGVKRVVFSLPDYGESFIANFNVGEMVQLYERTDTKDYVCNRQLVRGYIEEMSEEKLTLVLAYEQRLHYFSQNSLYAIEHDSSDASFQQCLRGLYALLLADNERRALLLGQRLPRRDEECRLVSVPPESVRDIVLQAKQAKDYFLLAGPPGTGKTNVALRSMVMEFLLSERQAGSGKAILLMAYTNRAVDEICGMLETVLAAYPWADYVRIGQEGTCAERYRRRLLKWRMENCRNRNEALLMMEGFPIVVGTVMTLTNHLNLLKHKPFRVALLDEASQVLEPQMLGVLTAGQSFPFIMIGDHKQLPAVVSQPPSQSVVTDPTLRALGLVDLRNSLFERLYLKAQRDGCWYAVARLSRQGRMHPDIGTFVSREFYENALFPLLLPHQQGELEFSVPACSRWEQFLSHTRLAFVHVELPAGCVVDNPKANVAEAEVTAAVVKALERMSADAFEPGRVGVIVPFRAQIGHVKAAFRRAGIRDWADITVDTVECYQGSQRDFIVFSTTVCRAGQLSQLSELHTIEGVSVDRKLNVAVTRARLQFVMVGNARILQHSPLYRRYMEEADYYSWTAEGV